MNINPTQLVIFMAVFIIGFSIYKTWSLKDHVYCTFRRKDKTQISKYAKITQGKTDFDGGWYYLNSRRTTLKLVWNFIIPTWVRCLDFRYDSNQPLDPETFNNDYDDPRDRKALNRSEAIQSLMVKQNTLLGSKGGKKSFLESLMPIIMIGGFLIVGYFCVHVNEQGGHVRCTGECDATADARHSEGIREIGRCRNA